jgi:Sel1 repeat
MRNISIALLVSILLLSSSSPLRANQVSGLDRAGFATNDPPGRVFPGKYFEYKAQFYLRKKDYRQALDLFELAGFWANKIAQYNAGLMYYNGIGVPADPVRGVAWLGIAAEAHDDLALRALQLAYASLSEEQKHRSAQLWKQLDGKYGDAVAVPRALQRYDAEAREVTGSHVGFIGDLRVYEAGPGGSSLGEAGSIYYRRQEHTAQALLDTITGHVTVGKVMPLKIGDEAKAGASPIPLIEP